MEGQASDRFNGRAADLSSGSRSVPDKKTDSRPGHLVSMFCLVHGNHCNEAAKEDSRPASILGHNCKSKPEIPVAVLASIRPELQCLIKHSPSG